MHRFLRKYLELKVHLKSGQTPGTGSEGKKKNVGNYAGGGGF